MKKYVAGFLAGALFVLSASAFADDIQSLVGKKIQGQTVVKIDGQELDTAIIVDGKSYSPTRSIGEAAGFDVSMQGKEIILNTNTSSTPTASTPGKGQSVEDQITRLKERIAVAEQRIADTKKLVAASESVINDPSKDSTGEESFLEMRKANLAEQEALLTDLESQLAVLTNG
ncbi:hypothetical protein ASD24_26775 [Paenibacillus sp. Root52]|uniref:hypothetical protein n=1 Tax=Paenibacillus sp. Root52 TaxID=1736552 RepID=UPI0006F90537|nr:hypothetical protein [Paenibacillus sp. Root52]KQY87083.1 hypothetical protein ASD24_26775 [Paenibacillus sp. Root52]